MPPENIESLAKVARAIDVPLACGERSSTIYGFRELIERDIVTLSSPIPAAPGGCYR